MTTPFHQLDYDAQVERLDHLAREALDAFGLADAASTLMTYTNNAVFRVADGDTLYALRIHRPGLKSLAWIRSELEWLTAINQDGGLCVPKPAAEIYTGALEGVELPVYCVLLTWIDGYTVFEPDDLSMEQVRSIGAFAARLHDQSARFTPSGDFDRPRLDWEGLFGQESPYYSEAEAVLFTGEQREVIAQVTEQVHHLMDVLDHEPRTFGLIHADLILKNFLFNGENGKNHTCAIDFDDCAHGYYLYDLAPMLWRCKDEANYEEIRDALWEGYASSGTDPRPAHHYDYLKTFVAARQVASCRWIAGNADHPALRGQAADIIAKRVDELRHFLQAGQW